MQPWNQLLPLKLSQGLSAQQDCGTTVRGCSSCLLGSGPFTALCFPLGAHSSVSAASSSSCVPKHVPELQDFCILLLLSLPNLVWHTLLNLCPAACEAMVGSGSRPDREAELIKWWKGSSSPDPGNYGPAESGYMQVLTTGAGAEVLQEWLPLSPGLAGAWPQQLLCRLCWAQGWQSSLFGPVWLCFPEPWEVPAHSCLYTHTREHLLLCSVQTTGKPGTLLSC